MVTYRPALSGDAPACVDILTGWIEETLWMPRLHDRASMEGFWGRRLTECPGWVAVSQDRIVGFCLRDGECVTALYLRPETRNQGVGRALLDRAKMGQDSLQLWVFAANARALMFYRREGFAEAGRTTGDNEEGLPDIDLRWRA